MRSACLFGELQDVGARGRQPNARKIAVVEQIVMVNSLPKRSLNTGTPSESHPPGFVCSSAGRKTVGVGPRPIPRSEQHEAR